MFRLAVVLTTLTTVAVLVGPSADADAGRRTLAIKKPRPIVAGLTWVTDDRSTIELQLSGTGSAFSQDRVRTSTIEVVRASDDRIDAMTITYGTVTDDPRSGKAYRLEAGASGPSVSGIDGAAVSAEEAAKVIGDHGELLRRTPLRSWLVGKRFRVGKAVDVDPAALSELVKGDGDYAIERFAVTLETVTKSTATFRFEASFGLRHADADVEADLAGDATGRFTIDVRRALPTQVEVAMTLSGVMTSTGTTMTMSARYDGARTVAYQD
jgi:hypothetical protein